MCFPKNRLAFLTIILLTFFTSCDNPKPREIPPLPKISEPTFNEGCTGMPNCNDKQGLEVKWEPGVTREIVQRKEFLSQIPIDYTGHIKLCGENGLYRYIECKNGKVDGISIDYDCDGGYDEQYYKNSIAEGTWIHYNKSMQYDFVRNFKNGQLHGEYLSYGDNLQLYERSNYRNGELNGESIIYYPNGQIEKYSEFNNGFKLLSKEFYENGQLKSEFITKNGRIKKAVSYDESGNIILELKPREAIKINRP